MRRDSPDPFGLLLFVLAGFIAGSTCGPSSCHVSATHDPARDLARVLHCEAGASARDVPAILWALENRRGDRAQDFVRFAGRYSTCRVGATPWARTVMTLDRPRYLVEAREWLAGERPPDPCGGRARGWAHPRLVPEARRLDCGDTANSFVTY